MGSKHDFVFVSVKARYPVRICTKCEKVQGQIKIIDNRLYEWRQVLVPDIVCAAKLKLAELKGIGLKAESSAKS